jgi:hypothetical protein
MDYKKGDKIMKQKTNKGVLLKVLAVKYKQYLDTYELTIDQLIVIIPELTTEEVKRILSNVENLNAIFTLDLIIHYFNIIGYKILFDIDKYEKYVTLTSKRSIEFLDGLNQFPNEQIDIIWYDNLLTIVPFFTQHLSYSPCSFRNNLYQSIYSEQFLNELDSKKLENNILDKYPILINIGLIDNDQNNKFSDVYRDCKFEFIYKSGRFSFIPESCHYNSDLKE